jgi:hypothetical protein
LQAADVVGEGFGGQLFDGEENPLEAARIDQEDSC